MSKFDWAGFLIFVLVFVSRDVELDRSVSCEESTVSRQSCTGLIFSIQSSLKSSSDCLKVISEKRRAKAT